MSLYKDIYTIDEKRMPTQFRMNQSATNTEIYYLCEISAAATLIFKASELKPSGEGYDGWRPDGPSKLLADITGAG